MNTELDASRLGAEQLDPLKEELVVLSSSVDEKIAGLLKEIDVLAEWSEVKRSERAQVGSATVSADELDGMIMLHTFSDWSSLSSVFQTLAFSVCHLVGFYKI